MSRVNTTAQARALPQPGRPLLPYGFFLPAFALVMMVSFLPLFYALRQSLYKSNYLDLGTFVGVGNFTSFFTQLHGPTIIWQSLTFVGGSLLLTMPLGIGLALLLNLEFPLRNAFRVILVTPWLVSSVVTAMLWAWLLNGDFGPISPWIAALGGDMPTAVTSLQFAMPALVVANCWHLYPLVLVLVLAALQTIPADLHEAALVDGATPWQRFRLITIPLISNTILVALVLCTLNTFNNAALVFVMTGGGPIDTTRTLALSAFLEGFKFYRIGLASAIAVICFAFNAIFTLLYIRVLLTSDDRR